MLSMWMWMLAGLAGLAGIATLVRRIRYDDQQSSVKNTERELLRLPPLWRLIKPKQSTTPVDGLDEATPVRSLMDVGVADDLSASYAELMGDKRIQIPLRNFLLDVKTFDGPGLVGIALGTWTPPGEATQLSLYGLVDERYPQLVLQETQQRLIAAFGTFLKGLKIQESYPPCTLSFIHTGGRDTVGLSQCLKRLIAAVDDPFVDDKPTLADLSTLSLAQAA